MCINSNASGITRNNAFSNNDNKTFTHVVYLSKNSVNVCRRREKELHVQSCVVTSEYACIHGAYCGSNIPAIIQHAEQARRHNAIRPRSKGAREYRREREREWERVRDSEDEGAPVN